MFFRTFTESSVQASALFDFFGFAEQIRADRSSSAAVADIADFPHFVVAEMALVGNQGSTPVAGFIFRVHRDAEVSMLAGGLHAGWAVVIVRFGHVSLLRFWGLRVRLRQTHGCFTRKSAIPFRLGLPRAVLFGAALGRTNFKGDPAMDQFTKSR
jgi:hypothetical protein